MLLYPYYQVSRGFFGQSGPGGLAGLSLVGCGQLSQTFNGGQGSESVPKEEEQQLRDSVKKLDRILGDGKGKYT